jgi:hypothetical protein
MVLTERCDFHRWLVALAGDRPACEGGKPGKPNCDRCGVEFDDFHACGLCLVCLAERFGREQAEEAAYVGRALMLALLSTPDIPLDVIRASVEDVLDDYEVFAAGRAEAAAARE